MESQQELLYAQHFWKPCLYLHASVEHKVFLNGDLCFSPSVHHVESDSSIFPLHFSLLSFSHYKWWSGSVFPSLCSHIWSAVVGTESSYSEVLQIHLLYFSLLGQDHTAFHCWGFLRRQPVCVPVTVRRSESIRFASNRERPKPGWVENGRLSLQGQSRKVQEQGEKGRAGAEDCRSWRLLLTSDSGSSCHINNSATLNSSHLQCRTLLNVGICVNSAL